MSGAVFDFVWGLIAGVLLGAGLALRHCSRKIGTKQ